MGSLATQALRNPGTKRRATSRISKKPPVDVPKLALSTPSLIQKIQRGFPFKSFESFVATTGLSASQLAAILAIPERTLARRKSSGLLSSDESERLLRVQRLYDLAFALFEDDSAATLQWLTTPKLALGNQSPLTYARTEVGGREVEMLLGRIEHGVFA